MIKLLIIGLLLNVTVGFTGELEKFTISTKAAHNHSVVFWLRIPQNYKKIDAKQCRIMVLFGGRNWTGNKTIKCYKFDSLADKYKLFLLSPSFKDDEYWYPEKWSGKALLEAIAKVRLKYGLSVKKRLLYYGYSAGGQCVNLFLCWKPEIVKAWGVHACGVWSDMRSVNRTEKMSFIRLLTGKISGLVTCGEADEPRMLLSRNFIYGARENGMKIIWRSYRGGHELQSEVLQLGRSFFIGILNNDSKIKYVGDDQAMEFFSADSNRGKNIEIEYRNEFLDLGTAELWRKKK